ncbi:hypothetical protein NYA9BBAC_01847 [Salinibacterium sp. NYA9b]
MKKTLIAGAAGVVLASCVGLAVALPAQAETLTTATSSSSASESGTSATGDRAARGHSQGGARIDAATLATALGLTETEVSDAVTAVRDATEPSETTLDKDATADEKMAAKDARQAAFATALAAELNVDEDAVTTALADIRTDREAAKEASGDERVGGGDGNGEGTPGARAGHGDRGDVADRPNRDDDADAVEEAPTDD